MSWSAPGLGSTAGGNQPGNNGPVPVRGPHAVPEAIWGAGGLAGGSITVPGSGDWTITRTSVGNYTVTFASPFNNLPAISTDLVGTGTTNRSVTITGYSASGFSVQTLAAGSAADQEFHFIANAPN